MKFTVTPLGGGRADTARVVDSIVWYLQPPPKIVPSPSLGGGSGHGGVEQYYADRGEEAGRWLGRTAEDRVPGRGGVSRVILGVFSLRVRAVGWQCRAGW